MFVFFSKSIDRNNAKALFNTLLKITQYAKKKKKRKNKVGTFTTIFASVEMLNMNYPRCVEIAHFRLSVKRGVGVYPSLKNAVLGLGLRLGLGLG